jgi:hypothetical protein
MTTRSRRETSPSGTPSGSRASIASCQGAYEVITDEEMIEGLSFASFRRVATMIMIPVALRGSTMEMISIGAIKLSDAQRIDASAPHD